MKKLFFTLLLLAATSFVISQDVTKLPTNKWVKLKGAFKNGYTNSQIVYDKEQGKLIHWGAVIHNRGIKGQNDVRRFDPQTGLWSSDYPSDPKQSWGFSGGGSGNAISYTGYGYMLPSNRPNNAMTVNAATYDSKRKKVVYSMTGLMVSYDTAKKTWKKMNTKTILYGKSFSGGPQAYGAGMCYDPINDEIIMFPHFGAQNVDRRDISGRVTGHWGTMIYSYKTNTWTRAFKELGTPKLRKSREKILAIEKVLSPAIDNLWALQLQPNAKVLPETIAAINNSLASLKGLQNIDPKLLETSIKALEDCLKDAKENKLITAEKSGGKVFLYLDQLLENELAIEPPVRAVAPMIYDSKNQVIVMFGGDNNQSRRDLSAKEYSAYSKVMNDTWVYHCKTKQWENISTNKRPPAMQAPSFIYDPKSGLFVLVQITGNRWYKNKPRKITMWTLDVIKKEWKKVQEAAWDGEITDWVSIALDEKNSTIILTQTQKVDQYTWAMKLDLNAMKGSPVPEVKISPKIKPIKFPKDDAAWLKTIKEMPVNTWLLAKAKKKTNDRGWGNIAIDHVSGNLFYFGGGHSSYQGTDIATYSTGNNTWIGQAGDQNDSLPKVGWGGFFMGLRGASNAVHQRNSYVALNNRVYQNTGLDHPLAHMSHQVKRGRGKRFHQEAYFASYPKNKHYAWMYDTSRGGVWRHLQTKATLSKALKDKSGNVKSFIYGRPNVTSPQGKIYGFDFLRNNNSSKVMEIGFHAYDAITKELTLKKVPLINVDSQPEGRAFALMNDKNQIFYQFFSRHQKKATGTFIYDIKTNKFTELKIKQPAGLNCIGMMYLEKQNAIFTIMSNGWTNKDREVWIYSFESKSWRIQKQIKKVKYGAPYCQMDYSKKYGVIVTVYKGSTWILKPDVSKMK